MLDNQAINEMYCLGPPCPALGEGAHIKHTHLALTSGGGPSLAWGQDHGQSPMARGAASARARRLGGATDVTEERRRSSLAGPRKQSLHCPVALKPQLGRGEGSCPCSWALESGQRNAGPMWRKALPCLRRRTQHKGTLPTAGDAT